MDVTKLGDRSARKDLALHFPISIGNNLEVFTILRKVYTRISFRDASRSIPGKSPECWRILPIPVEHSESSTLLYCLSQPFPEQGALEADVSACRSASVKLDDLNAFKLVAHNEYLLYYAIRGTRFTRRSSVWCDVNGSGDDGDDFTPFQSASTGRHNSYAATSLQQDISGTEVNGSGFYIPERSEAQIKPETKHFSLSSLEILGSKGDFPPSSVSRFVDTEPCEEEEREEEREEEKEDDDNVDTEDGSSISGQSDTVPEAEWMASSLAVFRMVGAHEKEEICLLDYLKNAGDDKYIVRCVFHPVLPLLAFHCVSDHVGKIVLWNFRSFECSGHGFETTPRFETLVEKDLYWTESLQFSACGEKIIVEEYLADCPTIIPLGERVLYKMAQELQNHLPESQDELRADNVYSMSLAGETTLPQNKIILHDTENSTQLNFQPNSIHSDIDLVKINDGSRITQPLVSLPKHPGIQHANVSILPTTSDDRNETMIRMIITKSPKMFCSLADPDNNDSSPVIVAKEARALLPARKRKRVSESSHVWESLAMPTLNGGPSSVFETVDVIQAPDARLRLAEDMDKESLTAGT